MGTRSKGLFFDGAVWLRRTQHGRTYPLPAPSRKTLIVTQVPAKRRYRKVRSKR